MITIEYYRAYERILQLLPQTPILIWIRDPRTNGDWDKIRSLSFDADNAQSNARIDVALQKESLHRLLQSSTKDGRPILFAHQAEFLVPKAKVLYDLPSLESVFLPNAIPQPTSLMGRSTTPMVCFLGRLDPIKRPWIFFSLAQRFSHVQFMVAGKTHFPEVMDSIIAKYQDIPNLKFLGSLSGIEKDRLLQQSWALINTSVHEALPVTFIEALANGTSIVSCQNPDGLVDRFGVHTGPILGDGLNEESLTAFERALHDVLDDKETLEKKAEAARKYFKEVHTFEACERRLNEILQKFHEK